MDNFKGQVTPAISQLLESHDIHVHLQNVVQELDCQVGLHVAARRLTKSSSLESRLSTDASWRAAILF